jgi:hypothetical protein
MADNEILAALDGRIAALSAELERYRAAAALIRGDNAAGNATTNARINPNARAPQNRRQRRAADPKTSTVAMIDVVFGLTDSALDANQVTERMQQEGWITTSGFPVNTVRTALGRAVEKGTLVRLEDGRFERPNADDHRLIKSDDDGF